MKLLLFLILIVQMSAVNSIERDWICSNKLKMQFSGTTAINDRGIWIRSGATIVDLTFDINNIISIYIMSITYYDDSKENDCEHKEISKRRRVFIDFYTPYNNHKLRVDVNALSKSDIINGKRNYMFVVKKIVDGKEVFYYKNFTFNISYSYM